MSKHEIGCLRHCPGGGDGGGWLGLIAAVVILIVASAMWKTRRGVETGLHTVTVIGEVILWCVVAALVLGVVTGIFLAGRKIYRGVQASRDAQPVTPLEPESCPEPVREPVHRITTLPPAAPRTIENLPAQDRTRPEPATGYGSRAADWAAPRPTAPAQRREVDDDDPRTHSRFR